MEEETAVPERKAGGFYRDGATACSIIRSDSYKGEVLSGYYETKTTG